MCVFTICSPAPAPQVLDLRTIMDMEASFLQNPGAAPQSPGMLAAVFLFMKQMFC